MKLFLLSQNKNDDYDCYRQILVSALTSDDAKLINPSGKLFDGIIGNSPLNWGYLWASQPSEVIALEIGIYNQNESKVIMACTDVR